MNDWDPAQYLKFGDHRLRPAIDLMARLPAIAPRSIWDLGCGTGEITAILARRFPDAVTRGLDSSPAMLAKARALQGVAWVEADIASWRPDGPADLIFSNAALHWLPDHAGLFARLAGHLAPGGVLAVQMPRNFDRPSHTAAAEAAGAGPWAASLADVRADERIATPAEYFDWLSPRVRELDIWEVDYQQALRGEDPIVEWTRATSLRPYLERLQGAWREGFLAAYRARVAAAYPRRADGITLFAFRRLFILARA